MRITEQLRHQRAAREFKLGDLVIGIRRELYTAASVKHRYWSGSPKQSRTKLVHIARPEGVVRWKYTSDREHDVVFDRVIVDTYCSGHFSHPVDLETTDLQICPICLQNAPEEGA